MTERNDEFNGRPEEPNQDLPHPWPSEMHGAVSAKDFIARSRMGSAAWFWEGILPRSGVAMIAGEPFAGKTVTAIILAAAAQQGGVVAGRSVRQLAVLYVKLEHLDADFAEQLTMAAKGAGLTELKYLYVHQKLMLDDEEQLTEVKNSARHLAADVIIIDSFRRAHQGEENSSQEAAEIVRRLHDLTSDGERLVVVLHHLAKGNANTPRGSGDFLAGVDTFVTLKKVGNDGIIALNAVHHRGGVVDIRYRLDFGNGKLVAVECSEASSSSPDDEAVEEAVLEALRGGTKTKTQLRSAVRERLRGTGVQNESIDSAADRLSAQGKIRNTGSNRRHAWCLA